MSHPILNALAGGIAGSIIGIAGVYTGIGLNDAFNAQSEKPQTALSQTQVKYGLVQSGLGLLGMLGGLTAMGGLLMASRETNKKPGTTPANKPPSNA